MVSITMLVAEGSSQVETATDRTDKIMAAVASLVTNESCQYGLEGSVLRLPSQDVNSILRIGDEYGRIAGSGWQYVNVKLVGPE